MDNYISPQHLQEWVDSSVNEAIIHANVRSLSGDAAYTALLYGIGSGDRRNDGRLRDRILAQYSFLDDGGWWCSGVNVLTGKDSDWGCYKPDRPRTPHQKNKPVKYEHPKDVPTEIFALKVPDLVWETIADYHGINKYGSNFWEWVKEHPQIPIFLTEGAKKAGALLSAGYVAIALPGVNNGYRADGSSRELIPQLKVFCQRFREFVLCFDQDKRFKTRQIVTNAIIQIGTLLRELGSKASVLDWKPDLGKGIDDVIARQSVNCLESLIDARLSLSEYEQKKRTKIERLDAAQLLEFSEGEFEDRLSFDELRGEVLLDGSTLELSNELKFWFVKEYEYQCTKEDLLDCLLFLAKQKRFNPVKRYLESVQQTAHPVSIDNIASRYFGTSDPLYDRFVRKWLIGAVARALNPGCQMDYALILLGRQGLLKSTFFQTLGGEFFDDSVKDISSDEAELTLYGSWIQELAEFDRITRKKEAADIKHFITRKKPKFRKKYDREVSEHPRRSVICGSVNKDSFLIDETGNRRFWVIPVDESIEEIDIERLQSERDGIWASAIDAYVRGELPRLSREEELLATENSKRYEVHDDWESEIAAYLKGREWVSVSEILEEVFNYHDKKYDRQTQMRVSGILSKMGCKKLGMRDHRGKRQQVYLVVLQNEIRALNKIFSQSEKKVERVERVESFQSQQDFPSSQPFKKVESEVERVESARDLLSTSSQPNLEVESLETLDIQGSSQPSQPSQPFPRISKKEESTPDLIESAAEYLRTNIAIPKQKEREKYKHPDPIFEPGDRVEFEGESWEVERASHTHATIAQGAVKKIVCCWECNLLR